MSDPPDNTVDGSLDDSVIEASLSDVIEDDEHVMSSVTMQDVKAVRTPGSLPMVPATIAARAQSNPPSNPPPEIDDETAKINVEFAGQTTELPVLDTPDPMASALETSQETPALVVLQPEAAPEPDMTEPEPDMTEPPRTAPDTALPTVPPEPSMSAPTIESPLATSDPRADFVGWMKRLPSTDDPTGEMVTLAGMRDDARLRDSARMYLAMTQRRADAQPEAATALVFAIGAAAQLKLVEGQPTLKLLCDRALKRVMGGDLPEVEQHFALSALRYIDNHADRFDPAEVYTDFEAILTQAQAAMEAGGEEAVLRVIGGFRERYEVDLKQALGLRNDTWSKARKQADADAKAAIEAKAEADELARLKAVAEAKAEADELARRKTEVEQRAAQVAADEAAELTRLRAEAEARAIQQSKNEAEAVELAQLRADAERRAALVEQAQLDAEAAELTRLKAEAEARVAAEAQWAQQAAEVQAAREAEIAAIDEAAARAAAEAAVKIAEAEAIAAKAQALRTSQRPMPVAPVSTPAPQLVNFAQSAPQAGFAPLGATPTPSFAPLGATPTPSFAPSKPAFGGGTAQVPDFDGDWGGSMPSTQGNAPFLLSVATLAGVAGGIMCILTGLKLGGWLVPMGLFWIVGSVGLLADRRSGWMLGLAAFGITGAYLIGLGSSVLPEWLSPGLLLLGGALSIIFGGLLLIPPIRSRYGQKRRRF